MPCGDGCFLFLSGGASASAASTTRDVPKVQSKTRTLTPLSRRKQKREQRSLGKQARRAVSNADSNTGSKERDVEDARSRRSQSSFSKSSRTRSGDMGVQTTSQQLNVEAQSPGTSVAMSMSRRGSGFLNEEESVAVQQLKTLLANLEKIPGARLPPSPLSKPLLAEVPQIKEVPEPSCSTPTTEASEAAGEEGPDWAVGDMVRLGDKVPTEFRGLSAVVTKVADQHCTVAVLSEDCRHVLGELWPYYQDVTQTHRLGRLSSRVEIFGMKGPKTACCNGCMGTVVSHQKEGHPCFIAKPNSPQPLATVCVQLDSPPRGDLKKVLVDFRYLTTPGKVATSA
eukprot:TRINITY_DN34909_c0_g1_i1.p1 TRINITY_DN34909_c0_g1~~TRINITY_DN34909_c0_g1_i1.p1  ORF type:complete len:340 (-),score=70.40 TRINITY_DN34909_c0_g1_i1:224-1243(-)